MTLDPKKVAAEPTNAGFNVDRFIADLPQLQIVDQERMLKNLSALRTPMVDSARPFDPMLYNAHQTTGSEYIMSSDSPLYTPLHLKENTWDRMGHALLVGNNRAATAKSGESADSVSNLEHNLKKIWQCSAF